MEERCSFHLKTPNQNHLSNAVGDTTEALCHQRVVEPSARAEKLRCFIQRCFLGLVISSKVGRGA